jgi:hypothetical protein
MGGQFGVASPSALAQCGGAVGGQHGCAWGVLGERDDQAVAE